MQVTSPYDNERAGSILSATKALIYPAKSHCASEPSISVLEAVSCGTTLITTGFDSTREVALQTNGIIFKNKENIITMLPSLPSINWHGVEWAIKKSQL